MPEDKGSKQGSTMYIVCMCEGDNHGIMLKCMYVSLIVYIYVCIRCLYGDGGCLGGSGHGHSDYSIGLA